MLIERYGFCGGAAVAGMSGTICGLYAASERRNAPEQVVFGFSERFAKALRVRAGSPSRRLRQYLHRRS